MLQLWERKQEVLWKKLPHVGHGMGLDRLEKTFLHPLHLKLEEVTTSPVLPLAGVLRASIQGEHW